MPIEEGTNDREDPEPEQKVRRLRVRVVDHTKDARPAVNINVPIDVAKWGIKMAQRFSPDLKGANLDWDAISAMIEEGERGKIVDVEDEAEHKTIEVWVE
jgi:hypothetical protein